MMKAYKDLSGKKFRRLTVIKRDFSKKYKRPHYLCKCDCGKEIIIVATSLTRKSGYTSSCGCLKDEYIKNRTLPLGQSCINSLFARYKNSAIKRNYEFNITKELFSKLIKGKCYYCGQLPKTRYIRERYNGSLLYNGIDRINNNLGYIKGNCVSCCKVCNLMKLKLSKSDFINQVIKIYNKQK